MGGGAGIVLSRAAADQLSAVRDSDACDPLNLKWTDRMHSGGDAWLGDCAENAGVHTDMEFGFYPQPPVSNLFSLYKDAVAFHGKLAPPGAGGWHPEPGCGVSSPPPTPPPPRYAAAAPHAPTPPTPNHRSLAPGVENHAAMHAALAANGSDAAYDPRCVPVFVDHKYNCLPHFIIGGVPKAGTTSLYKYLMQHPDVVPAEDKELTFWGNFFTPKHRPGRDEVMSDYLTRFPKISPSDFKARAALACARHPPCVLLSPQPMPGGGEAPFQSWTGQRELLRSALQTTSGRIANCPACSPAGRPALKRRPPQPPPPAMPSRHGAPRR